MVESIFFYCFYVCPFLIQKVYKFHPPEEIFLIIHITDHGMIWQFPFPSRLKTNQINYLYVRNLCKCLLGFSSKMPPRVSCKLVNICETHLFQTKCSKIIILGNTCFTCRDKNIIKIYI